MPLSRHFKVGQLSCHTLEGGLQRLDGGAMFGVVPKPLWERQIAPDERNRIPLAMRCLLIEHPDGLVLVDTGAGNKDDAKFRNIYGIENAGVRGATQLEDALAEAGYAPGDVKLVINTHLHFDHAGGNTVRGEPAGAQHADQADGFAPDQPPAAVPSPRLAFPNATYCVQRGELEYARHTNERTRASYLPPNFEPVAAAGRFRLLEGDGEVVPGISVRVTPGHVPWHQVILVADGGDTAAFVGDLFATAAHLPLVYIMGYDVEPLRTLESKRSFLRDAVAGGWRVVFEHDANVAWGWPVVDRKGHSLRDQVAV
jgi:glyoxylase-like metal-dependent hydrolase (beta-lactamase superfamily II)